MRVIRLDSLQKEINKNRSRRKNEMEARILEVKQMNLEKGRVRPKDSTEVKILARFKQS